jgi:hypothetical protein
MRLSSFQDGQTIRYRIGVHEGSNPTPSWSPWKESKISVDRDDYQQIKGIYTRGYSFHREDFDTNKNYFVEEDETCAEIEGLNGL